MLRFKYPGNKSAEIRLRSRTPNNTRSRIFCPTPTVQLDHVLRHTPKLGTLVEMVQFLWNFLQIGNSCCAPRFPLIASFYKSVDNQTSFTLFQEAGATSWCRRFWGGRTFYLRPRNPGWNIGPHFVTKKTWEMLNFVFYLTQHWFVGIVTRQICLGHITGSTGLNVVQWCNATWRQWQTHANAVKRSATGLLEPGSEIWVPVQQIVCGTSQLYK